MSHTLPALELSISRQPLLKRKLRNVEMIKIRLMGEREEIKIIIENISHINDVRILSLSDFYANRGGASDYGRIYMEVEKKDAV